MLIEVKKLTKYFGKNCGVEDLSFAGNAGDIIGLIGKNGSGKSTTMKMIVGYLYPSEGDIYIGGYEMKQFPQETKSIVGYLPEHNPLYIEMYVREYLEFMAKINGVKQVDIHNKIIQTVIKCDLDDVINKRIFSLSKGYRQRVGLAQAIIHDPKIIVLDEPTTGLDPVQIIEIRKLIKEISKEKLVLLSTHILQEVESICNRIIIINKGKCVFDDTIEKAKQEILNIISVKFKESPGIHTLKDFSLATKIEAANDKFLFHHETYVDIREELFHYAIKKNLTILEMKKIKQSIEKAFHIITSNKT